MTIRTVFEEIKRIIQQINQEKKAKKDFYVFFSFDLVNSTKYKQINPQNWPQVFNSFYEVVQDELEKKKNGIQRWKYVGDELLLFKKITKIIDIYDCIVGAHETMIKTINFIQNEHPDSKPVLSIQSTIWGALIERLPSQKNNQPLNNVIIFPDEDYRNCDFLGPEIDIGFRISEFSRRQRLVVCCGLAYLIYEEKEKIKKERGVEIDDQFKIVSYEILKGIWDGRRYPIIWFEKKWSEVDEKTFLYDERFESLIVDNIINSISPNGKNLDPVKKIGNILEDLNIKSHYFQIKENLQKEIEDTPEENFTRSRLAEVHCVAVCFDSDGRILLGKRRSDKILFPECWEFGCGQISKNETFEDCLRRNYQVDLGINLDFGNEIHPIKTYNISNSKKSFVIPGIIFIASAINPKEARANKHSEISWKTIDEIEGLDDKSLVPDLKQTAKLAKDHWEKIFKNKTN